MKITHFDVPDALRIQLHALHDSFGRDTSKEQSVRGGTQISILNHVQVPFQDAIGEYVGDAWKFAGMWSVRLSSGGYHVQHNHPKGDVSGCYYVDIPDASTGQFMIGGKIMDVEPGLLVLFPSETPHGTSIYFGEKPRLTVAFDVVRQ